MFLDMSTLEPAEERLVFTWPVCNCHAADGHQKLIATLVDEQGEEHLLLSVCQNILWVRQQLHKGSGEPRNGPGRYSWDFHLHEPSAEWHAALLAMED